MVIYLLVCLNGHREAATGYVTWGLGSLCQRCDLQLRLDRTCKVVLGRRHSDMVCYGQHQTRFG